MAKAPYHMVLPINVLTQTVEPLVADLGDYIKLCAVSWTPLYLLTDFANFYVLIGIVFVMLLLMVLRMLSSYSLTKLGRN